MGWRVSNEIDVWDPGPDRCVDSFGGLWITVGGCTVCRVGGVPVFIGWCGPVLLLHAGATWCERSVVGALSNACVFRSWS